MIIIIMTIIIEGVYFFRNGTSKRHLKTVSAVGKLYKHSRLDGFCFNHLASCFWILLQLEAGQEDVAKRDL